MSFKIIIVCILNVAILKQSDHSIQAIFCWFTDSSESILLIEFHEFFPTIDTDNSPTADFTHVVELFHGELNHIWTNLIRNLVCLAQLTDQKSNSGLIFWNIHPFL